MDNAIGLRRRIGVMGIARFSARFASLGFTVHESTRALMRQMVADGEVASLVPERVWQETLRALEEALLNFPGTILVISHDRWFLDRVATHMLAFEGDSQVEWFAGNFSDYEAWRPE